MTNTVLSKKSACATTKSESKTRKQAKATAKQEVPCCEIRFEECRNGCKIYCTCDSSAICRELQELCCSLKNGCCSVQCCCDGQDCCECCFAGCECKCETVTGGVCICCTSNDEACIKMIQDMCRCLCSCCDCGCECTVCINGKPVCCSAC